MNALFTALVRAFRHEGIVPAAEGASVPMTDEQSFVLLFEDDIPIRVTCVDDTWLALHATLEATADLAVSLRILLLDGMLRLNAMGLYNLHFDLSLGQDGSLVLTRLLLLEDISAQRLKEELYGLSRQAMAVRQYLRLYSGNMSEAEVLKITPHVNAFSS